jgi:hypothetical protein
MHAYSVEHSALGVATVRPTAIGIAGSLAAAAIVIDY